MATAYLRLMDIKARAEASFKEKADRREQTSMAWQSYEDHAQPARDKTAKLRELRLAKEEADRVAAPAPKPSGKRSKVKSA